MRRFERMVRDPVLIGEFLKMFDFATISMFDEEYPYAVPVNFGYDVREDRLSIYFHTVKEVGHKLALMRRNPKVCVTFAKFHNFPHTPYKKINIHDFRSVMAFGKVRLLKFGSPEFGNAMVRILAQADRAPNQFVHSRLKLIDIFEIECGWGDVYGKSESPIPSVEDVPFINVLEADPNDTEPYDTTDLVSKKHGGNWSHDFLDEDKEYD